MGVAGKKIWDQFIIIKNFKNYPFLSSLLQGFEGENLMGYAYIDHEEGITLDILKLFSENNGTLISGKDLIEDKTRAIVRFEHFSKTNFEIADSEIQQSLNVETPNYIKEYSRDDLAEFRKHEIYQKFSAEGFPDDITVFLIDQTGKHKTENIWVRIKYFDAEKEVGIAKLIVQPFQKLGVNKGDEILFKLVEAKGMGFQPFGFIHKTSTEEVNEKKWWKFW